MPSPIVLITGATSGFGEATARRFAAEGWRLILTGRRRERLESLSGELAPTPLHLLSFDVRDRHATEAALDSLPEEWKEVDVLINNAGLALGRESIEQGAPEDWEQMIDTNVKGLLWVTRAVAPWMIARKKGTILNVGSIAGREGYPGGNVYSATKFAVDALTRSIRMDLLPHGIRVGQIAPGAAETAFSVVRFHGDADKAAAVYAGFEPLRGPDIADALYFMATRPSHVTIQDMLIMPTAQASSTHIHRT